MRILELILAPIEGGAHTLVDGLTRTWRAQGHEVDVLALDPAPNPTAAQRSRELFGFDVPIIRRTTRFGLRTPVKQGSRLIALRNAVRRGRYDVVHAHCMQPNIYGRLAAIGRSPYPPVVATMHSPNDADYLSARTRLAERVLLSRTAAVIAVSETTADDFRRMFPAAAAKVVVIPNGIPRDVVPRAGSPLSPTRFLALSRIHPQKDIITMIRGFDEFCRAQGNVASLRIAGGFDGPSYQAEVMAVHAGLAGRRSIEFLGSRSDVVELLADADAFVHTATHEAHSVAILEAAAAALPIVTSDLPSIRDTIGPAADYFPPGDWRALAEALNRLTQRWSERTELAHRAAAGVMSKYSMRACAEAHLAVLKRAVSTS